MRSVSVPPATLAHSAPERSACARSLSLTPGQSVLTHFQQSEDQVVLEDPDSPHLVTGAPEPCCSCSRGSSQWPYPTLSLSSKGSEMSQRRLPCTSNRLHMGPITNRILGCAVRWHCHHPGMSTCTRPYATAEAILGPLGSALTTSFGSTKCGPGSPKTCSISHSTVRLNPRHGGARTGSRGKGHA